MTITFSCHCPCHCSRIHQNVNRKSLLLLFNISLRLTIYIYNLATTMTDKSNCQYSFCFLRQTSIQPDTISMLIFKMSGRTPNINCAYLSAVPYNIYYTHLCRTVVVHRCIHKHIYLCITYSILCTDTYQHTSMLIYVQIISESYGT